MPTLHPHQAHIQLNCTHWPHHQCTTLEGGAWDTSIQDCMSHLTTILHQHHTDELTKIQEHISSPFSALTKDLPQEVSSTLIHIASTHKPSHKRKTLPDPTTKPNHKTPTKHRKTKHNTTKPDNSQDFRKQPHHPHHKKQPYTSTPTPPLRIPLRPPNTPTPHLPTPHPPKHCSTAIQHGTMPT